MWLEVSQSTLQENAVRNFCSLKLRAKDGIIAVFTNPLTAEKIPQCFVNDEDFKFEVELVRLEKINGAF
ncbi:Uncharacterised protein [Candidatus Tiddalikarchaeum anstoanum]|nr:Uncharacterised protein [Candidatus Tiddalikarchaeum anstoanum]